MSNTYPVITKKSFGLAGIAAVGACAACCAVPLLAAAGIGGAALSAIAGYIRPGADLVLGGVFGAGVLGAMALRARARRAAGCDIACGVAGGCGCAPADKTSILSTALPRPGEPIVCRADLRDKPTVQGQLDGYRAVFQHLLRIEKFDGGVRWVFRNRPGLAALLRNLAEKEHQCCAFFKFDLRAAGQTIVWETTASKEAAAVLDEFGRLPERLSQHPRGNDEEEAIKQAISDAGLIFAADTRGAK
jgi:mercuric ion transport protein